MRLLSPELRAQLPRLYEQEDVPDPVVYAKFFTPDSSWTWYVTEGEESGGDYRFFGLVVGFEKEWGYFLLSDLVAARGPLGLAIERDQYFDPAPISSVRVGDNL